MRNARTFAFALAAAATTVILPLGVASATPHCALSAGTRIYTQVRMVAPQSWEPVGDVGYVDGADSVFVGCVHGYYFVNGASTAPAAPMDWRSNNLQPFIGTTDCDTAGDCEASILHASISRAGDRVLISAHCVGATFAIFPNVLSGCYAIGGKIATPDVAGVLAAQPDGGMLAYSLGLVTDVSTAAPGYRFPASTPVLPTVATVSTTSRAGSGWHVGNTHALFVELVGAGAYTLHTYARTDPAGAAIDTRALTGQGYGNQRADQQPVDGMPATLMQSAGAGGPTAPNGPVTLYYADASGMIQATEMFSTGRILTGFRQEGAVMIVSEQDAGGVGYVSYWNVSDPTSPWKMGDLDAAGSYLVQQHATLLPSRADAHVLFALAPWAATFASDGSGPDPACGDPNFVPDYCNPQPDQSYITYSQLYRFRVDCDGVAPGAGDAGVTLPDASEGDATARDAGDAAVDAARTGSDGGVDAGAHGGGSGAQASGCGCVAAGARSSARPGALSGLGFALAALWGRRRRRRV